MTIQIAQRIGRALNVRSATRLKELDTALREYVRSVPTGATLPIGGVIDTSQVTSGTFEDARIAQSNVTQHEAALSIDWLQLDSVPSTFTPAAHVHAAADVTSGTFANARIAQSNVTQHQAALAILESQITDGSLLARLAANETVSGAWTFDSGRITGDVNNSITPSIYWSADSLADDATGTFAVPAYGFVIVVVPVGGTTSRYSMFWVASSALTITSIDAGALVSLNSTVNPDVDGNINIWLSNSGELSVKNRHGSTRQVLVFGFGRPP